jgi:hypothetical protein
VSDENGEVRQDDQLSREQPEGANQGISLYGTGRHHRSRRIEPLISAPSAEIVLAFAANNRYILRIWCGE